MPRCRWQEEGHRNGKTDQRGSRNLINNTVTAVLADKQHPYCQKVTLRKKMEFFAKFRRRKSCLAASAATHRLRNLEGGRPIAALKAELKTLWEEKESSSDTSRTECPSSKSAAAFWNFS